MSRSRILKLSVGISVWLLVNCGLCYGVQSDIDCLRSIKDSLKDPFNYLNSTWNFNNDTEGFICKFTGVDCWHPDESKVLNIRLADMGLKGQFPRGLKNCTSITGLDLSSNELSGPIPDDIDLLIGFVTSLDLSSNAFSGPIPTNLSNCSYLNVLNLDHNRLTGQIPGEISNLGRIKTFNVANNLLSGPLPRFHNATIPPENYANNPGLCGGLNLDPCIVDGSKKTKNGIIIGATIAGVTVAAIGIGIALLLFIRKGPMTMKKKDDDPEGNKWAKSLKAVKGAKASYTKTTVSMFEKSVSKMKLNDLMKATNNFHKDNIIGSGRTGTMYKAVLEDGTALMVKRLQDSQRSEQEFLSEMNTLGSVKHSNLLPLLGFCIASKERLVVYENMENGSLYVNLHGEDEDRKPLEWSVRLKIAIRAAKGFAWLHHNCNPRILHRNISSKCIMLDAKFEPRISDFGLARLMNPIDTHLSTFVNGEFGDLGYVAPEYARTLRATPKGDVYSFGIVLLELVTSEKPTQVSRAPEDFRGNLVDWVKLLSSKSKLRDAMDKSLLGKGVDSEVFQVLKVACNCVGEAPKERPTMFEVYQLLRAIGEQYQFTAEDEMMMPADGGDADFIEELIVARDGNGIESS
ncbi:Probably inactive leucine-rich repeat receptor-like protein kinase At5g48380 [Linum perenne]